MLRFRWILPLVLVLSNAFGQSTSTDRLSGLTASVAVKAPVKAVTTANITLEGEQTVNGVAVVEGDRVLVKDQNTASENGIYNVSTGDWTRAKDFDGARDVVDGTLVVSNNDTSIFYRVTTNDPITIGTSSIVFEVVSGTVTQSSLGQALYPRSTAEIAASVTPTNYYYPHGNLLRYGGAGDDSTANDTAFSNAFAQFKNGGAPIYIPAGTYRVSSQLLYTLPDPTTSQTQGLIMRGEGMYRTIIKSAAASTSALRLSISDVDSAAFQNAVVLSDFSLIPNGAPATLHGLQLTGVYQARIERVRIEGFTGHGIYQPLLDATFTGGPDYYGATFLEIWNCQINSNTLHGIWSEMGAAFIFSLRDSQIQSNAQGGIYMAGGGASEIKGGSISYNGTDSNGYGGLSLARSSGSFAAGTQTLNVARVEFDRNRNYHVNVGALTNGIFESNRFIGADEGGTSAHVPPTHVSFNLVASGSAQHVTFRNNFHRRTDSTYAVTTYDLGNDANVTHVELINNRWASTSNTTKYDNMHASSRLQIEDTGVITRTNLSGSFARGRITTGTPTVTGSAANIVWSSETSDPNSALNTSTGIYTCQADGVHKVTAGLTIVSLGDGDLITMKLIHNTGSDFTAREIEQGATGETNTTIQLATEIQCAAGDTLRIQALQGSGSDKNIRVGDPYNWFTVSLDAK